MSLASIASYVYGQCTQLVAELFNWIPPGLGNASQWLQNAQAKGLPTGGAPAVGSVVVYKPGAGYSSFGHVAAVTAVDPASGTFTVAEQNFKGWNQRDTRVSTMADVAGFIYPPGTTQAQLASWSDIFGGAARGALPGVSQVPGVGDLAGAISGIPGSIGHGLANFVDSLVHNLETAAQKQIVALAVAVVVLVVIFL